ncbi:MAG: hypothetical protein J0L75_09405 [Spirochaetes bacterium]|nr:hypothetical protein [Spirochaetota bacterium]
MRFSRTRLILIATALLWPVVVQAETEAEIRAKEQKLKNSGVMAEADGRTAVKKISAKQAVLILPARSPIAVPASLLEKTGEVLSGVIIDLGRFQVVDRKALKKAMEQMALSATGVIPEDKQLEMGKVVGATEIIEARINAYSVEYRIPTTGKALASAGAGMLLGKLLNVATGGNIKAPEDDGKRWVALVEATLIHKDLATGKVKNKKDIRVEAIDKDNQKMAENKLDSELETEMRFAIKEMFPIVTFIVKKKGRDTYMRLGADMGVRPNNKYFAYEKYDSKAKNVPVGEMEVNEVFPTVSRGNMRMQKGKIEENFVLKERNLRDGQFNLLLGVAPMKVDTSTFASFRSYVSFGNYFGFSDFATQTGFLMSKFDYVPQVSLSYAGKTGRSALDVRLSAMLGYLDAYGGKLLAGYKYTAFDRDWFTAGFSVHAGAAATWVPVGKMSSTWYFQTSSGTRSKQNSDLSIFGLTAGGEVAANLGFNLGFDTKMLFEVGYCYYLPMNKYQMVGTDTEGNMMNLSEFFDTSRVAPIDLSGVTANLSFNFSF